MRQLKKIMYAEDEPDVQMVVELTVQTMSDYEIKICENGRVLLENIQEYEPDLVLLDVMMPEMDGPTTLKNLKQSDATKNLPVIFMTAKAQVHEIEALKSSGVVGVITKPFDPVTLCDEIEQIWKENFDE
jgi:CheY-like chemotaxis protein